MLTTIFGRLRRLRASIRRPRAQANVIQFPIAAAAHASEPADLPRPVPAERELTILSYDNVR